MGLWEPASSATVHRAAPAPEPVPEPIPEPTPAPEPEQAVAPEDGLTRAEVEELLEDMVRPALQADGGDITLVRVEPEGDVFVELVGACSTCPSATVTMRQGIERLMHAELEGFRSLIEINGAGGVPTDFH
ncbi:MAG: NifU family protein [Myxococcales bacterium]|nr:NifU family protein [Myxococcales bacterium]